jgi:DNA-directed RNA polymerase subunit RPC12/RpoP
LNMGRPTYVCVTCSERFTRKYSAKRHNITIHGNGAYL